MSARARSLSEISRPSFLVCSVAVYIWRQYSGVEWCGARSANGDTTSGTHGWKILWWSREWCIHALISAGGDTANTNRSTTGSSDWELRQRRRQWLLLIGVRERDSSGCYANCRCTGFGQTCSAKSACVISFYHCWWYFPHFDYFGWPVWERPPEVFTRVSWPQLFII